MPIATRYTRRQLLAALPAAAAAAVPAVPQFRSSNQRLQSTYDAALAGLQANVQPLYRFPRPLLIEGATYIGAWLECAPLEGLAYAPISLDTAFDNHTAFFDLQREDDGYIPCNIKKDRLGTGQIQMVVPIAATAWDLYRDWRQDAAFLEKAYRTCSRWDEWLVRYRNTRSTGLCEAFCTYDTGHDRSPRFAGKPNQCPNADARVCAKVDGLPYLAPDLSATVYGGRIALAAMAREMNRKTDEARWLESAAAIRQRILDRLYDPRDAAFYDLDSNNRFVRVRGDAITRVMGEHVADQALFDEVWRRQLHNPDAFWRKFPFPSVAADDSQFVRPIPRNSWGGASQALTALRTPRWMGHYGKYAELTHLMQQWTTALVDSGQFLQQMDPDTGAFSPDRGAYSPAMLTLFDFVWRLYGVRRVGDAWEWNCHGTPSTTTNGPAHLENATTGSTLILSGRKFAHLSGGPVRLTTNASGRTIHLTGTHSQPVTIHLKIEGRPGTRTIPIAPNQRIDLA